MKRFKFKLEKILGYRRFKEDQVRNELGRIRGLINREIEKKNDLLNEERRSLEEMKQERMALSGEEVMNYDRYRKGLKKSVADQDLILADLRGTERKVIEKYLEARKYRMVLEKLKERKYAEYLYDMKKAQKKEIEEVILNKVTREIEGFSHDAFHSSTVEGA